MKHPFRNESPQRTCTKQKGRYSDYKDDLINDFHHRCGYTDCSDFWFGGSRNFQIDHLKPWTKHPGLKTEYSNLVYCCSYVNRAKWDDDSPNYLDPCEVDYNIHFERDDTGVIIGNTNEAKYMVSKMHLNLIRYSICWALDRLQERISKLKELRANHPEINPLLYGLEDMYFDYVDYLHKKL